jgi:formylglycine-generating enzyme required for sulfatase activity
VGLSTKFGEGDMHRLVPFLTALALAIWMGSASVLAQALSPEREAVLKPGETFKECDSCPEMVVVPAGSFTMGSPDSEKGRNTWEGPQHVVTFAQPFAVGRFEVTVDQFAAFVKEARYQPGSTCWTFEDQKFDARSGRSWRNPGYAQDGTHPAACLSWRDAIAYAEWLSGKSGKQAYRLLTEAEWEYAARARTTPGPAPQFAFGDDEQALCTHGNGLDQTANQTLRGAEQWPFVPCSDGFAYTAPVGKFSANEFGLHDVLGNVKEWTQDCFQEGQGYKGAPTDGSAWTSAKCRSRILRGGSWVSYARLLRVAFRYRGAAEDRVSDYGIRVARTLLTR